MKRQAPSERARRGEDQRRLGDGDGAFDRQPRQDAADGERPGQRMRGDVDRDADGERAPVPPSGRRSSEPVDRQLAREREGEAEGPQHGRIIAGAAC